MKEEFRRFYNSKVFISVIVLFIVSFFSISFLYISRQYTTIRDEKNQTIRYESKEELLKIIEDCKKALEPTEFYTPTKGDISYWNLELYQYLYDNDISYNDFRLESEINSFESDKFGYNGIMITMLVLTMNAVSIFTVCELFSRDFMSGTFKYVYTRNISRNKIILRKLLVSFLVVSIISIIGIIMMLITRSNFNVNYKYIIYQRDGVFRFDVNKHFITSIFVLLADILINFFISVIICLFSKNYIKNIIIGFMIMILLNVILYILDIRSLNIILSNLFILSSRAYYGYELIINFIIRFIVCCILFLISLVYFNKKTLK